MTGNLRSHLFSHRCASLGHIYPMTFNVDFQFIKYIRQQPKGLLITTLVKWAIQPFTMYRLALLFFRVVYGHVLSKNIQNELIADSFILGGSPCTAMVFVWSALVRGNAVQVSVNDLLLLGLYAPTLFLLLHATSIPIPYVTIVLSVVLYVLARFVTRKSSSAERCLDLNRRFSLSLWPRCCSCSF
jgi:ACR3 family arsenite transporter